MKKNTGIWMLLVSFVLALFLMTGCEKNPEGALSEDAELELFAQDEEVDYLFDLGLEDSDIEGATVPNAPSFLKGDPAELLSPISNVVRFGRKINERFPRTLIIRRIAPDTVKVFLERVLAGQFVIVEKLNSEADTFVVHRKPLRHIVRRTALFVHRTSDRLVDNPTDVPRGDRPRRGRWELNSISLLQGNSPNSTIRIHEVTVETSSGQVMVFTDPLHTMLEIPDDIPSFDPGDEVMVRVVVENSTPNPLPDSLGATETVLIHYNTNRFQHHRKALEFVEQDPATGYNIYQGRFLVGQQRHRVLHAIVDVIDRGTIYDNDPVTYPYRSTTWSVPYLVGQN